MRLLVSACFILFCLLLCQVVLVEAAGYNGIEWFRLTSRYTGVVALLDLERDGLVETVAIDGFLYIYGSETPTGAYPFKGIVDETGELCLFLYNSIRGFMTAMCPAGFRRISAPLNAVPRVFPQGVIMSDIVYTAGSIYFTPVARTGVLLEVPGGRGVLGVYNETVVLHVLHTGEFVEVYPIPLDVLAAFYVNETGVLYVVFSAKDDTFVLEYNLTSRTILRHPVPLNIGRAVQGVSTRFSVFILTDAGLLYRLRPGQQPVLITTGDRVYYPADSLDSFTLKGENWVVRVIDAENETRVERVEVPGDLGFILSTDWWGSIVAVATTTGVYITTVETIEVELDAPVQVYAREPFNMTIKGLYETAVINVSGHVISFNGTLSTSFVLPSGEHLIQVRACRGLVCRVIEHSLFVSPRPLKVVVEKPEVAEPYQEVSIFIDALDVLTGSRAMTTCLLEDVSGRVKVFVIPGSTVAVPAIPDVDSAIYSVTCGGGDYSRSVELVRIKLAKPSYRAWFKYRGLGHLEVYAYDVYTGDLWTQELLVKIGNETVRGRGVVELVLQPGENRIAVYLVVGEREVFLEEALLVYYEDASSVPLTEEVIVADRVETFTTTIFRPVFIPEPIEVERPDPLVTVSSAVLAAGVTYALMTLIYRSRRVEHGG